MKKKKKKSCTTTFLSNQTTYQKHPAALRFLMDALSPSIYPSHCDIEASPDCTYTNKTFLL